MDQVVQNALYFFEILKMKNWRVKISNCFPLDYENKWKKSPFDTDSGKIPLFKTDSQEEFAYLEPLEPPLKDIVEHVEHTYSNYLKIDWKKLKKFRIILEKGSEQI